MEDESVLGRPSRAPDSVVAYGADAEQVADIRLGDARALQRPLLIMVHGGFWRPAYDRQHTGPMTEAIADAGWTVAAIEYRRMPGEPDKTLEDVALAIARLPGLVTHHNGRIVLMGHSAGGHLVLWAAAAYPPPTLAGAVALAPVADLQLAHTLHLGNGAVQAFLGTPPTDRRDVDPNLLPAPVTPTTIIHGADDEIVPLEIAGSYVASKPDTRLIAIEAAAHFSLIDPHSDAWTIVLEELNRLV